MTLHLVNRQYYVHKTQTNDTLKLRERKVAMSMDVRSDVKHNKAMLAAEDHELPSDANCTGCTGSTQRGNPCLSFLNETPTFHRI